MTTDNIKALIRDVPDFPKKGIVFKDITPLLHDPQGLKTAIDRLSDHYRDNHVSVVVAAEARGFIIGPPIALNLKAGFVPVRKQGKLPYKTKNMTYELEYGTDTLEIHEDAIKPGQKVLMVDDVLATGGTMAASCKLVESMGGHIIGCAFLIELTFLNGRKALEGRDVFSLIQF
ncbi:MAG: adenine phosphoribosyltransferase [Candidatus Brocadiales bacterium]